MALSNFLILRCLAPPGTARRAGRPGGGLEGRAAPIRRLRHVNSAPVRRRTASVTPQQRDEAALNLDPVGTEDAGLVGLVGRLEGDRGAAAAQPTSCPDQSRLDDGSASAIQHCASKAARPLFTLSRPQP